MTQWYYVDNQKRIGPIPQDEWEELVASGVVRPETLVWHRDLPQWTPYAALNRPESEPEEAPETLEALDPADAAPAHSPAVALPAYPPTVGQCLRAALRFYVYHFSLLFAAGSLLILLFLLSQRLLFTHLFLPGVLGAGLIQIALDLHRTGQSRLTRLFSGFQRDRFFRLAFRALFENLAFFLCLFGSIFAFGAGIDPDNLEESLRDQLLYLLLPAAVPILLLKCFWIFADCLILDRPLSFSEAMRVSFQTVWQHFRLVAMTLLGAGLLIILPGVTVTLLASAVALPEQTTTLLHFSMGLLMSPLYFATVATLYEAIFQRREETA